VFPTTESVYDRVWRFKASSKHPVHAGELVDSDGVLVGADDVDDVGE